MKNLHGNIYNIFLRSIRDRADLHNAITRAGRMGFDMVYFNPFFKTGNSGSLYSVADYFSYDPFSFESGADPGQQVAEMIELCRQNGMTPMVDLVINHTAVDSHLLWEHPDFYAYEDGKVKIAAGRDPEKDILWYDLAQLDYSNLSSGLWEYMLDVCRFYIGLGFQGFRCDAADQVPLAFWIWLISRLRRENSDLIFIGEAYLCPVNTRIGLGYAGFNYIYNSAKWWDYGSEWLSEEYNATRRWIPSISFPDSHDTCRLMESVGKDTGRFLMHLYFTAFWAKGFQITWGTEFAYRKQLDCVSLGPWREEKSPYDFTEHIREVIKLRNKVFWGCDHGGLQKMVVDGKGIEFTKPLKGEGCVSVRMDLKNTEVTVWEHTGQYDCTYRFNCAHPVPDILYRRNGG